MNGLNRNGCVFLCFYHERTNDRRYGPPDRSESYATLDGLRAFLAQRAGEALTPSFERILGDMMHWAEVCAPGSVQAFFEVHWVIAIDLRQDHDHVIDNVMDHDAWMALVGGHEPAKAPDPRA